MKLKSNSLKILTLILTLLIGGIPTYAVDWKTLYANYLSSNKNDLIYENLTLLDINRDGIPELFGGANSLTYCPVNVALTINNGKIAHLTNTTDGLCGLGESEVKGQKGFNVGYEAFQSAELYKDTKTGQYKWIGKDGSSINTRHYSLGIYELTLKGTKVVSDMIFYEFHDEDESFTEEYKYQNKKVTKASYTQAKASYFKNLQKVPNKVAISSFSFSSFNENNFDLFATQYQPLQAKSVTQNITVDGKSFKVQGYNINNLNYFKLRDLAMIFKDSRSKFGIGTDEYSGNIVLYLGQHYSSNGSELKITTNSGYSTAITSNQKINTCNDPSKIKLYKINGNNYIKLRDITTILNSQVNTIGNIIQVTTKPSKDVLTYAEAAAAIQSHFTESKELVIVGPASSGFSIDGKPSTEYYVAYGTQLDANLYVHMKTGKVYFDRGIGIEPLDN